MDKGNRAFRDRDYAVLRPCRGSEHNRGAASEQVHETVLRHDRIAVDLVERETVGGVSLGRDLLTGREDIVLAHGLGRVLHRHDSAGIRRKRHHVGVGSEAVLVLVVGADRIKTGPDLPTIGHSVAVGVPDVRVGAPETFIQELVGLVKTIAIPVAVRRYADVLLDAVRNSVVVEVRVLHEDKGRRSRRLCRDNSERDRRVDVELVGANFVLVTPSLPVVTLAVAVLVDKRHHVVLSGFDAIELHVRSRLEVFARVLQDSEIRNITSNETLCRDRRTRERGIAPDAYDDVGLVVLCRAVVADLCGDLAVTCIRQRRIDSRLELRPGCGLRRTKLSARPLGVEADDAPVVRRVVVEVKILANLHVLTLEDAELLAVDSPGGGQAHGLSRIYDARLVLRSRDLQHERRGTVKTRECERGLA